MKVVSMNTRDVTRNNAENCASATHQPARAGHPVIDPACWTGDELAARDDWIFQLGDDEIGDLAAMVKKVRRKIGDDPDGLLETTAEDFDLGAFGPTLEQARDMVTDGLGVVLLRGLPAGEWERRDLAIAYWGLGRHMGKALPNNPEGEMFGHIADLGKDYGHPLHRGYQTSAELYYHSDHCDVLTLLCLRPAKSGGITKVASSVAVHNDLLRRHPDLLAELTFPFCWSRHGEEGPEQEPWFTSPVFNYLDGSLSVSAGFMHIEKGHGMPDTPDLTRKQREAHRVLQEICEELQYGAVFEPGDIPILNSHVTVHARTAFEDWPDKARRRHLWRMWLRVDGMRPRAPFFEAWRDGIWVPPGGEKVVLEA
jgi:hypothetical protein